MHTLEFNDCTIHHVSIAEVVLSNICLSVALATFQPTAARSDFMYRGGGLSN